MKKLLLALIAAAFASATMGALAADSKEPYTSQPKVEKPGRAADDSSTGTTDTSKPKKSKSSKKKKSTTPAPAPEPQK